MKDRDLAPRKAPQQDRSRDTVDAVFEAMLQMVDRHEVADPSMQAIADRAGVSVGSIYQYFPSKTALVNGLIRFHLRRQMEHLEVSANQAQTLEPRDAARFLVDAIVDDKRKHSKLERGLLRFFLRAGDLSSLTQYDDEMHRIVRGFLSRLGDRIRRTDLDLAAFIIANALRTSVLLSLAQAPERLDDPRFKAELVLLVVRYLEPEPERVLSSSESTS